MDVCRMLEDDSGQGSVEYLLTGIGALVIAGIFFYAVRDAVRGHLSSISAFYR